MVWTSNYVVLDTETTGLSKNPLAEVIEVGVIALDRNGLSEIGRFQSLIKPANIDLNKPLPDWSKKAFEKHQISVEELMVAPSPEDVCHKIIGLLKKLSKPILVGQNIDFDVRMLRRLFRSCDEDFDEYFFSPIIDLYSISYMFWRDDADMPNVQLGTVAEKLKIKPGEAHRALGDCETSVPVFKKFMDFIGQYAGVISDVKIKDPKRMTGKYACPMCGYGLSLRTAKRGVNKNNKFYGCKGFPSCRFTCQLNEIEQYERNE